MAKELDDCTPLELHEEIRSIDCTQERAHEIRRYAEMVSHEEIFEPDGGLAWSKSVSYTHLTLPTKRIV